MRDPPAMAPNLSPELLDMLPLPQRLALSYAPARARNVFGPLFALDARLGQALRQASEPIMAQMRLAWWRDQLRLAPEVRERSDELIRALDPLADESEALLALVDGWELLLSEEFSEATAAAFISARAQSLLGLARTLGAGDEPEHVLIAGQRWALADLVGGLADPAERARALALTPRGGRLRLSRTMRPLAVLDELARRSLSNQGAPLIAGRGSVIAAMRLGLFGR